MTIAVIACTQIIAAISTGIEYVTLWTSASIARRSINKCVFTDTFGNVRSEVGKSSAFTMAVTVVELARITKGRGT